MTAKATASDTPLALCLSGGGFRATLFHLGVVKALRSHNIGNEMALKQVKEVYAVSGGAILAAHMLKHWPDYIGDRNAFEGRCQEVLALARRDVRNRVLRRWLLTWFFDKTRGHWIQQEYEWDKFLGKTTLGETYGEGNKPTFHFLATNLKNGELCSFSGRQFEWVERPNGQPIQTNQIKADMAPLAFAVTASSAFPIVFPPIYLTSVIPQPNDGENFPEGIELADDGVFDNLAIEKFVYSQQENPSNYHLIVSNAGASFKDDPDASYAGIISRNMRANDVMMRRVGEASFAAGKVTAGDHFTTVRISATTDNSTIDHNCQSQLRHVRTDLDCFDATLADLLIEHGENVATDAFAESHWQVIVDIPSRKQRSDLQQIFTILKQAGRSKKRTLLFSINDLMVLALWLKIFVIVAFLTALVAIPSVFITQAIREDGKQQGTDEARNIVLPSLRQAQTALEKKDLVQVKFHLDRAERFERSAVYNAAASSVEETGGKPVKLPEQPTPNASPIPPVRRGQIVYIQFAGELTRGDISNLNKALNDAGWDAQGGSGERIETADGLNEVRYSGDNRAAAQELADAINGSGLLVGKPVTVKPLPIIGKNILEVWISK